MIVKVAAEIEKTRLSFHIACHVFGVGSNLPDLEIQGMLDRNCVKYFQRLFIQAFAILYLNDIVPLSACQDFCIS